MQTTTTTTTTTNLSTEDELTFLAQRIRAWQTSETLTDAEMLRR